MKKAERKRMVELQTDLDYHEARIFEIKAIMEAISKPER